MTSTRADALVVVFTAGVSLRDWVTSGLLPREWPLYRELRSEYGRLVFITHGGPDDLALAHRWRELTESSDDAPEIICNTAGLDGASYAGIIPTLVAERLEGCTSALVKTNQMQGGDVAPRIAHHLRAGGIRTALLARGGYLWSRFVASEHGTGSPQAVDAAASEAELCRSADVVIGTTQRMLDDLSWRYALDGSRLHLVPNYVLAAGEPVPASERDRNLVLYAGQLVQRKRVDVLIEAIAAVKADGHADVVLEVIGDGPEAGSLRQLAERLHAPVRFHPRVGHGELLARMSRCALYTQASELEGHPKTVLEAMSTGAAVVVADSPGLSEVVQIGATGLRVGCDASSFAHAISQLLSDEDWRHTLGLAAASSVRQTYALVHVIGLERRAHDAAMALAGIGSAAAPPPVRFDPALIHASTDDAAGAFGRAVASYVRRLPPARRATFIAGLSATLTPLDVSAAVARQG